MNDLMLQSLSTLPAEYRGMLERIAETMPAIRQASENFYKSASQFKTVTLDNTALTQIRTIKQILAECDRTRMALEEAYLKTRKNGVEIRRRQAKLQNGLDVFDRELVEIEITELQWQTANVENGMCGAVRKLAFQMEQYRQVLAVLGKDRITEVDYEREEARYHIMTAFKQALIAARARDGHIDEGNHIYLFDLGINGAQAQAEVTAYLELEREIMSKGKAQTHAATIKWLRACADKFEGDPHVFAALRGLTVIDEGILLGTPVADESI